jgi:hypothetical protein
VFGVLLSQSPVTAMSLTVCGFPEKARKL